MICTRLDATVSSGLIQRLCTRVPSSSQTGGGRWGGVLGGMDGLFILTALFAALLATSGCHSHAEASQQVEAQVDRSPDAGKPSELGHPKVCSLLSPQEVSAATKLNIVNATSDEDDGLCKYSTVDDGVSTISVQVDWEGGKFALQAGSKLMENAASGTQFRTPVAGIGDEAFVLGVNPQQQNQINHDMPGQLKGLSSLSTGPLMFRKNDVMVTVTANFIENKFEAEKQMAAKVASRL